MCLSSSVKSLQSSSEDAKLNAIAVVCDDTVANSGRLLDSEGNIDTDKTDAIRKTTEYAAVKNLFDKYVAA